MHRNLKWFIDQRDYDVDNPVENRNGQVQIEKVKNVDSYSQWILGYGTDFDMTNEIEKEDSRDFDFITVIDEKHKEKLPDINIFRFPFTPDPDFNNSEIDAEISHQFVGRLPIRNRSFPKKTKKANDDAPKITYTSPTTDPSLLSKMVIVGLIDDGINIGHEQFRGSDGTSRVDFSWVQDADALSEDESTVEFGREWFNADINHKLEQFPDDDDALMRSLDLFNHNGKPYQPDTLRFGTSHGTHVADLAGGNNFDDQYNDLRRLITVQLPGAASQDTSGTTLTASILSGVEYIYKRALHISRICEAPIPVVLSFSYGLGGGPRNGRQLVERVLRAYANEYEEKTMKLGQGEFKCKFAPMEVVLPAGNGHLSGTHARSFHTVDKKTPFELDVLTRVQPNDLTSSFVEFWYSIDTKEIVFEITPPGRSIERFKLSLPDNGEPIECDAHILAIPDVDDHSIPNERTVVARINLDSPTKILNVPAIADPTPFWRILLCIAPTETGENGRIAAPVGLWRVNTVATNNLGTRTAGPIEAWVQRDDSISQYKVRGRQAYFDDDAHEESRFDQFTDVCVAEPGPKQRTSIVTKDGTVSGIATDRQELKKKLISIGGYRWDNNAAAVYTAAGNLVADDTTGISENSWPEFMAVSDTSRVLSGVLAAGTRTGSVVQQGGTSVAAPQVARMLADGLCHWDPRAGTPFEPVEYLAGRGMPEYNVPRPGAGVLELASNSVIREQRVRYDLLNPHEHSEPSIERGVAKK